MFSSFFFWRLLDLCAVEFSLHDRHGMWYGEGRDRCFLITNCCCGGWFKWFFGCWRNWSLLGGCRRGWWRVWAAPVVVGAAFSRKFSLISLTNSSIAITSLLVCLLGIILELSFNSCKFFFAWLRLLNVLFLALGIRAFVLKHFSWKIPPYICLAICSPMLGCSTI